MSLEARNRSLPDWFTKVRNRSIVLPRFQRFEAWTHAYVCDLFNTALQGLPIGAMLILEIGDTEPFISRPLQTAPENGERITEHLLDGQQRLTALWRGLHNSYPDRTYYLIFAEDEESKIRVGSIARWKHDNESDRRPLWANKPPELWKRKMIPLDLLAPGENHQKRLREWLKGCIDDSNQRDVIYDAAMAARQKLASFNIPYLSLPPTTDKDTALRVFIKMNTSAAPLSTYDIVVAQIEAAMGRSLHDLVAKTREECPTIEAYYGVEDLTLYAGALLQGRAPIESTYLSEDFGPKLLENWDKYILGVKRAVAFLEEERVFDNARLPTEVVIPVLVALWANAAEKGDAQGRARSIIRKFLWRAFFTGRYERATNSRTLSDSVALKKLIEDPNADMPEVFNEGLYPLPEVGEFLTAGWPKKKDRLARAILALAIRKGGLDLADGSSASRGNLPRREYHHVFPDAHLQRLEVSSEQSYCALNCALVTWSTNRTISDKDPERYLAQHRDGAMFGEQEVRHRLSTHLIPYDEMLAGDYDAFLESRATLVQDAMHQLCRGEHLA